MKHAIPALAVALTFSACATSAPESPSVAPMPAASSAVAAPAPSAALDHDLTAIRAMTARYHDVKVAEAEGYMREPSDMCVTAAMVGAPAELGAMGVHWVHPMRLGINATAPRVDGTDAVFDFREPEVLVYEPQADGSMKLVATEYIIFKKAWDDAGNVAPPSFHGNQFVVMADDPATPQDEAHGFTPHYELHLWTERENPNGIAQEFNPHVTCEHHTTHTQHVER